MTHLSPNAPVSEFGQSFLAIISFLERDPFPFVLAGGVRRPILDHRKNEKEAVE
jgi:hypothetical protein